MNNKEKITKMVQGELTVAEAGELYARLHMRTDRQIIDDLKELEFESLINTEEAIFDFLDTMSELDEESRAEQKDSIEQAEKSLGYLKIAIKERCKELINSESRLKEMLSND
jgi:uncharacterized protein YjgD (DUF1641 family)